MQGDEGQPLTPGHITLLCQQWPQDRSKLGTQSSPKFSQLRRDQHGSRTPEQRRRLAASCRAPVSRAGLVLDLRSVSPSPRARRAGLAVPIPEQGALPPTPAAPAEPGRPCQPLGVVSPLAGTRGTHCAPTLWRVEAPDISV